MWWWLACFAEGSDTAAPVTTDPPGACDVVEEYDFTVLASVTTQGGQPFEGADVWFEDRGWTPGAILGNSSSDANGDVEVVALGVTMVEGCPILDYWLVAEGTDPTGAAVRAENGLNANLYTALDNGTFVADISMFPLELEPIAR